MTSALQVLMGTRTVDSGNDQLPRHLHLRSTWATWVMSKPSTLFISQWKPSFPHLVAEIFVFLEAQLDDTFPKIHFDISISIYALALQICKENIKGFIYQKLLPRVGCQDLELFLLIQ